MLEQQEFRGLLQKLGTPAAGQQLLIQARQEAPVREVRSNGKNIITLLASRKMAREIATESRTAEYAAALTYELDPSVLEYYPQPCTLKLELINPETGEVHAVDHTPDFLVIKGDQITLQEWKTEEKLMHLARRIPWRYEKQGSQWRSPQIEEQVAHLGITYEIHSNAEIHPNRTKNLEILEDYLHVGDPACSQKILERLHAALAEHGRLSIRDLLSPGFDFQADELNGAIAQGHLTCNLDAALLWTTKERK